MRPNRKIAIVANEFFDPMVGPMGGFGWIAREVALWLRDQGHELTYLTGEFCRERQSPRIEAHGIQIIHADERWPEYAQTLRALDLDVLLTIDYRPNYDFPLYALPDTPVIVWVQDPR